MLLFLRFPTGASLKITLRACNVWVEVGGKNATGVNPAGTKAAAAAWVPAVAVPGLKVNPPPA